MEQSTSNRTICHKNGSYSFASPWEPPANLAESGGSNGKLHLPKSNYAAYAKHLNDFGTYMKSNGVDLYAVSVQNEPDYASEWTYWSTDETTDFIANYGDQITSTRLMSPESFQYAPENASWVADGGKHLQKDSEQQQGNGKLRSIWNTLLWHTAGVDGFPGS